MVVICKDWQVLPVSATTISALNIETCPQPRLVEPRPQSQPLPQQLPDNIQRPTTHISSKPNIVELHEIKHKETIEPWAVDILPLPDVVKPKKKSQIIEQKGILDQFSFNSSSLMIGGAVMAGLLFLVSAGKGQVNTRIELIISHPRPQIVFVS